MKRLWVSFCLALLTLSIVSCGALGQESATQREPTQAAYTQRAPTQGPLGDTTVSESDFNLVFEFGVGGAPTRNVLDTERGTFTKDMIMDPPITVKLELSDQDLSWICSKMDEIDLWDYPNVLEYEPRADGLTGMMTPYMSYYFKATRDNVVKEVAWEDKYWDERSQVTNLRELIQLILETIESTDEYKALPEPRGGYM